MIDSKLIEFATEQQANAIRAYIEHGSYEKAAKSLGIANSSCINLIKRAKRKAAMSGYSPEHDMTRTAPDPFVVKGVSTYYNEDGKPVGQWVKSSLDSQKQLELIREVIDELKRDIKPVAPVTPPQTLQLDELLNLYVLTDIHLGALSWAEETGAKWDLAVAEQTILDSFRYLIDHSPPSRHGFLCQLGDALHYDGMMPVTPTSGHIVDADSRFHKVVRATIRIFRRVIAMLLERHEQVTVLMAQGNHDLSSSVWLQESFAALLADDPRCNVIVNPSPYYSHTHGKTFLGFHHGHRKKIKNLAEVFSSRKYWSDLGSCKQAYIHTGHLHHREVTESNFGIVEMHQTLAAPSSYESQGGYSSGRSMSCITYHSAGREQSRSLYYPEMPV
jgi:hypothetical protein